MSVPLLCAYNLSFFYLQLNYFYGKFLLILAVIFYEIIYKIYGIFSRSQICLFIKNTKLIHLIFEPFYYPDKYAPKH